jgi:hypothetical protein
LIVLPFKRWLNKICTVAEPPSRRAAEPPSRRAAEPPSRRAAEPPVRSAASSASRKEIPSRPGLRFSAAIEDVLPFRTSAVVVTTTMLRDTEAALEPATRAANPAAQMRASAVAMPAAIFTETLRTAREHGRTSNTAPRLALRPPYRIRNYAHTHAENYDDPSGTISEACRWSELSTAVTMKQVSRGATQATRHSPEAGARLAAAIRLQWTTDESQVLLLRWGSCGRVVVGRE